MKDSVLTEFSCGFSIKSACARVDGVVFVGARVAVCGWVVWL